MNRPRQIATRSMFHDVRGDRVFGTGNHCPGTDDRDSPRTLRQRRAINREAPGQFVMVDFGELPTQSLGVLGVDAGGQDAFTGFEQFRSNLHQVLRRLAGTEDHLRKPAAQRAVCVHLGKAQIGHGGSLESLQNGFAFHRARPVTLQKLNCFRCGHPRRMAQDPEPVTFLLDLGAGTSSSPFGLRLGLGLRLRLRLGYASPGTLNIRLGSHLR